MRTQKILGEERKAVFALLVLLSISSQLIAGTVWETGHHEIYDGDSYAEVEIYNYVLLDIFGGDIGYVWAFDNTITNWYDGEMTYLVTNDNSIANIYGGDLLGGLAAVDSSTINLYAHDIVITDTGGHWDIGQVIGTYNLNNEDFIFDLWGSDTYTHINIIPEPATLIFLSFGGCLFRAVSA
jgi:hypothetical protein